MTERCVHEAAVLGICMKQSSAPPASNIAYTSPNNLIGGHLSGYRERPELLPLMYWMEIQDLMFLIKNLQSPSDNFNILDQDHVDLHPVIILGINSVVPLK